MDRGLFMGTSKDLPYESVLKLVQKHMSNNHSDIVGDEEKKDRFYSYVSKYLADNSMSVSGLTVDELIDKLQNDMSYFSFLTDLLDTEKTKNIEEININAWDDIKITYNTGEIKPSEETFLNPDNATDIIRRLLLKSNMIIDKAQPIVVGHLNENIRITVITAPIVDNEVGVSVSIRIVNPSNFDKEDFINNGTATDEMLLFLSAIFKYAISLLIAGSTGSGKTTFLSWLLEQIVYDKRVYTCENNTREFNLRKKDGQGKVLNNVIHTVTKPNNDPSQNIDLHKLIVTALTFNPDYIVVGEMKSYEAFDTLQAGLTGHTLLSTIHTNDCKSSYNRITMMCKQKYDVDDKTLRQMSIEAFPIVVFAKKLDDNSRRITEIMETEILEDGTYSYRVLYRYKINKTEVINGKVKIDGEFVKENGPSETLINRLRNNGMPEELLNQIMGV